MHDTDTRVDLSGDEGTASINRDTASVNARRGINGNANELANKCVENALDTSEKESNRKLNFLSELKEMRKSYVKNIIVGQLNINYLRNKFLSLYLSVINETQFQINGYKCLRKDL